MSYIDVVQRTSLSWLIHARPYLTKRCSIKLKDEGAEIDDEGAAEFFSHRLRENQRTLVTLTLRIEEAFPNEVEVISDLNELVFLMNQLSRDFDRIFEDSERSTFTAPSSLNDRLSTVARNGLVGRPRLQILQQWHRFSLGWYLKNSWMRVLLMAKLVLARYRHERMIPPYLTFS